MKKGEKRKRTQKLEKKFKKKDGKVNVKKGQRTRLRN